MESLILLPMITVSQAPMGPTQTALNTVSFPQIVLSQKLNKTADSMNSIFAVDSTEKDAKNLKALELENLKIKETKAGLIDAYFQRRDMPLYGYGMKMVEEADKNEIDWRLLPAIAVRESTGGKFACKKATCNSFGWGSCKIGFKSNDLAIETVARNLGGNNPKTANHYDKKTTLQILRAYNPPSIVPLYAEQVISIMNIIGLEEPTETPVVAI